ncbi:MAG: hypothetical protein A2527_09585 [Candidatus Lambdaproteobacteria bacterium RIFOXYD2_FULL_50_16]|uniref:FeS cluster biogenesis domain-containing protein n=1 Tax=Candidatus Lambdaproteobacteria bacterium RIFOXYD2_FULL_50_16 TaxID=1817772 RepID=A0A1F6G7K2_9PROT|nr:MAG: hypothetical protein A2527_09585 [Candidatus Lambdaproteobacteria bacterium RIFOXYD2_FULL_50_16]
MFVITQRAAEQFLAALQEMPEEGLALRIFARRAEKGMAYNMGFDKAQAGDLEYQISGINVVVDPETDHNVTDMMIDFGQLDGAEQFIFANPQDQDPETCGSTAGSSSCGSGCTCG